MVNPLQRAKRKNAHRNVSRKTKKMGMDRAKQVSFAGVHPVIAKNWDKNLTLRQNYQRMGLMANLNGKAGGEGVTLRKVGEEGEEDEGEEQMEVSYRSMEDFDKMPSVSRAQDNADVVATAEDFEDEEEFEVDPSLVVLGARLGLHAKGGKGDAALLSTRKSIAKLPQVMETLEAEAALGEAPRSYHTSESEFEVLARLEKKHGDDYSAMQRDIKINTYQLSAGQLKRKFKRYHAMLADV
ncbi:Nucleolar protein 16 [Podochytrium sp. JEL0797]|nr:Nucleolar protein 16 [Podochytrium sp. JEL0797]